MDYFKLIYYGILMMIFLAIFIAYLGGKDKQKSFITRRENKLEDYNLKAIHELTKDNQI